MAVSRVKIIVELYWKGAYRNPLRGLRLKVGRNFNGDSSKAYVYKYEETNVCKTWVFL